MGEVMSLPVPDLHCSVAEAGKQILDVWFPKATESERVLAHKAILSLAQQDMVYAYRQGHYRGQVSVLATSTPDLLH